METSMKYTGFTLIELMVAVAIVAILTFVALPSYQNYVLKSHRTAAINALQDLASRQASYYTTNNTYATSLTALGYPADPAPVPSTGNSYYSLSLAQANASAFTLQAQPVGNQLSDICGTFTYNNLGVKGNTGATGTVQDCWGY